MSDRRRARRALALLSLVGEYRFDGEHKAGHSRVHARMQIDEPANGSRCPHFRWLIRAVACAARSADFAGDRLHWLGEQPIAQRLLRTSVWRRRGGQRRFDLRHGLVETFAK